MRHLLLPNYHTENLVNIMTLESFVVESIPYGKGVGCPTAWRCKFGNCCRKISLTFPMHKGFLSAFVV